MLTHRSLHLKLPNTPPYQDANALASFVGNHVRPLVGHLSMFWFSKYGRDGMWEVKFRFSTGNFEAIRGDVEAIEAAFAHGHEGCGEYVFENDLGGERFLAVSRWGDKAARALLVYQFLTAGARLFVDCLEPAGGGWRAETETTSGYNRETPMETFHHLFCNMTSVPTWASVVQLPAAAPDQQPAQVLVSDFQSRGLCKQRPGAVEIALARIEH